MEDFEKGAKESVLNAARYFLILEKFPIICPNCGYELTSLLTNVSKRGRPPKMLNLKKQLRKKKLKLKKLTEDEDIVPSVMMMMIQWKI